MGEIENHPPSSKRQSQFSPQSKEEYLCSKSCRVGWMSGRIKSRSIRALHLTILLASMIFHGVLFAYLAHYVAQPQSLKEAPTIQVSLVTPPKPEFVRRHFTDRPPPNGPVLPARTNLEHSIPRAAASPASDSAEPLTPGAASPSKDDAMAGARRALGGLNSCDQKQLTREEREQCQAQKWAHTAMPAPRLNLDPAGRFAKNPEPFLSRRPEEGCRIRLTGDVDAMGDNMNSRAGVTCVKRF